MKKYIILFIINIIFFLACYAVASTTQNSQSFFAIITKYITVFSTSPLLFLRDILGMQINGWILSLNFVVVAIIFAYFERKIWIWHKTSNK